MNICRMITPFHSCRKKIGNYKCGDFVGEPLSDGRTFYCKKCSHKVDILRQQHKKEKSVSLEQYTDEVKLTDSNKDMSQEERKYYGEKFDEDR